jgi:hypothetical protein
LNRSGLAGFHGEAPDGGQQRYRDVDVAAVEAQGGVDFFEFDMDRGALMSVPGAWNAATPELLRGALERIGEQAVGLEVAQAVDRQEPHRPDGATGDLIARGGGVFDVQVASLRQRGVVCAAAALLAYGVDLVEDDDVQAAVVALLRVLLGARMGGKGTEGERGGGKRK